MIQDIMTDYAEGVRLTKHARMLLRRLGKENPNKLRSIRGNKPQKYIALHAKVPQSAVSRFENGDVSKLSTKTVLRLLSIYHLLEPRR